MSTLVKRFGIAGAIVAFVMLVTGCHTGDSIAGAGSDTTFGVMGALTSLYNGGSTHGGDLAFNIPAKLTGSATYSVEGDKKCGGKTYNSTSNIPPDGSSTGIKALSADTTGCIDFARSSRPKATTDPSNLEFYAFAKDAVTWARFPSACPGGDGGPAGCAPVSLTQSQLKGIYNCSSVTHLPQYTNWKQVGGDDEPIVRYLPQAGSGTLSYFETRILGLSGTSQQGVTDDTNCSTRPRRVQENSGKSVLAVDAARSILPYSYAAYKGQANGAVTDVRNGSLLGNINGVTPSVQTITSNSFLGARYVFNVTKTSSPSYAGAMKFVGVRTTSTGGNGYICANNSTVQSNLTHYGFVPLPFGSAGSGLPSSRCRKNPLPL